MSRSGYSDDCENLGLWRGAVDRASFGKRGQQFFRDLVAALDALPEKRLIADDLAVQGEVCALGALGLRRGVDMEATATAMRNEFYDDLGKTFNIAKALAQETMYENDEGVPYYKPRETPEQRWERMRAWAVGNILATPSRLDGSGTEGR